MPAGQSYVVYKVSSGLLKLFAKAVNKITDEKSSPEEVDKISASYGAYLSYLVAACTGDAAGATAVSVDLANKFTDGSKPKGP